MKGGENLKTGVLLGFTMTGCILSGMMVQSIKTLVQNRVPVLAWLNPVNLLSDSFYCLYYYDSLHRYALNMAAVCAFVAVFCVVTYLTIRRRKYASI